MRKFIIPAVLAAALSVAACNTISGAGRDMASVGHAVTSTADNARSH